jgi:plasmid stabilization system protein ParE
MSVVFREEAVADLEEIARYIAQYDPTAPARVIARIHRTIYRTIAVLPLCGRLNPLEVVAVFHTARDPASKRQP